MIYHCKYDQLIDPATLKNHPKNRNKHSKEQIERLAKIIGYQGWRYAIKVSKQSGFITTGHGRKLAALLKKWDQVPVVYQDYESEEQEYADVQSDNAIASWAELDLAGINLDVPNLGPDFDIDLLGIKDFAIEPADKYGDKDADEVPEARKTDIKLGDLFQLGSHRLLCGDATKKEDVARLMLQEKADMVFTSPPYNSGTGGFKGDYYGEVKRFYREASDKRSCEEYFQFCNEVLTQCSNVLKDETSPVIWNVMYNAKSRRTYGEIVFSGEHPLRVQETICWDKGNGFPSASKGILSRNWELIFVLSRSEKYFSTQKTDEVRFAKWDISSRNSDAIREHGATFPVALAERALEDFSNTGFSAYDPFLGSGSTLIACEKMNRKCFGMEIDPQYCQVIIDRWEKFTGQKAVKLEETQNETEKKRNVRKGK